ncbi:LysR family transcriptional regulator [Sphingobium cupriresistens]|uniref:LysR family transcriptional regulator n=1 Tax=Sphingobium cupriresistens TaxID=1132417 RepID=A0A8G1ZI15_9SPHN|nr:LysR family transcriptional regulator [Sphingobium cupriresistens]RYM05347.1 LysR family transcriptional regulator [Sphingobium cupriresistens]
MDIRQLRYFTVLCEELHFRRAAERLNITQAPLSLAIQSLERELGAQLFHRTQRRVSLTEIGAAFRSNAASILGQLERAVDDVHEMVVGEAGHLRIGFTAASSLLFFFPKIIRTFRTRYPQVKMTLHEISSQGQMTALADREIDIGFMRTLTPPHRSEISFTHLVEDPLVVAMHAEHPLNRFETLTIGELKDEPLIFYPRKSGVGIYDQVIKLFSRQGHMPNIVQEAQESSTIISLAASGLGVAIVPSELQCIKVPNISFRPLSDEGAVTRLLLGCRAGEESALVANFRRLAQATIASAHRKDGQASNPSLIS